MRASKCYLLSGLLCWLLFAFSMSVLSAGAQTTAPNEWTWMGGSSTGEQNSVYGTLGTPASGNIPGCRFSSASSTDSGGNLWLFGGEGCTATGYGWLNDLWEFDPSTNEWTWWSGGSTFSCPSEPCGESGVYGTLGQPAAGNVPGGRLAASSWVDSKGNFWLFGGQGYDANGNNQELNDFWEFDPSTLEWTWIGGSKTSSGFGNPGVYGTLGTPAAGNIPGSRYLANSWTDSSGNLWLFGGYGTDANGGDDGFGPLNDQWEFSPSSKEWTWVGGGSTLATPGLGNPGVYGSLGVPASGDIPGGRYFAASWTDGGGHFWLFGGSGSNATVGSGYLNDLWEFNPPTNEWTWMSGSSTGSDLTGVYGTLGAPSPGNTPGGRETPVGWADGSGNIWLFGGFGPFGSGDLGYLNDFWEFNPSAGEWAWLGGSNTVPHVDGGNPGTYGTLGVPAAANIPGSRYSSVSWTGSNGNLWLFGGDGDDSSGGESWLNDLWEYQPYASTAAAPIFSVAAGAYTSTQTVSISDATTVATIYYTDDGTTPTTSSTVYSAPITVSSTETIEAIATASGYSGSAVATAAYTINLPLAATPTFSVPAGTYTSAQTVAISDAATGATVYYTTDGTTPTASSTVFSGPILVSSTETLQAIATASGESASAVASATYTIPPGFTLSLNPTSLTVQAGQSGATTITLTDEGGFNSNVSFACSGLPTGAACSFALQTVPTPAGVTYTTLTVTTGATSAALHRRDSPLLPEAALAVAFCRFGMRKRRRFRLLLLLAASAAGLGLLAACGSGGSSGGGGGGSQPVTSTVTVTATSGALQNITTFTLTVN